MGFVWQVRVRPGNAQWEIVKSALTVYKKELVRKSTVICLSNEVS
jgi:hypothetical protein